MLRQPVQLVVGLGNPGPDYAQTRHNAGAWLVEMLAIQYHGSWQFENKFHGQISRIRLSAQDIWLLFPTTFMNNSGQAVKALSSFYKIPVESILVAHDELDFLPGIIRLKQDGGHGGHNGLRDIVQQLGSGNFFRLRIGIGHPGHRDQVHDYVLNRPSKHDLNLITGALVKALAIIPDILTGDIQKAMQNLHSE